MNIIATKIAGAYVLETHYIGDERGRFGRLFCQHELATVIGTRQIVQINHSMTAKTGTVRGFHYQLSPHAEMKVVRCLLGRVWDVVLDLRCGSPTFLQWYGTELSATNGHALVIPEGCAHGFQVLEDNSELLYCHTEFYAPRVEGGVHVNDPALAVSWPLPVQGLSVRDSQHPLITEHFLGIVL